MPTLNPMKRHHDRCREVRAQMSDYLDGDLDAQTAAGVERHARWCPNCRRMLTNLRRTLGGLHALRNEPLPGPDPPADV
jgi:anti-sigma factor RsiW